MLLFLHALLEGRRMADLEQEARAAHAELKEGRFLARGGGELRRLIPADSRFWEIAETNRLDTRRPETATLRTAVAALMEIANAGDVYDSLDAALP